VLRVYSVFEKCLNRFGTRIAGHFYGAFRHDFLEWALKMGRLTTHVLDTANGCPGAGLQVELYRVDGERLERVTQAVTNSDGRCDAPLLDGEQFRSGVYQLHFLAGDYFRGQGTVSPEPAFLDVVVLRFGIDAAQSHYHVPLLISPYSYSTYRGS
jgi:5-hydroxyisourate hydrolase